MRRPSAAALAGVIGLLAVASVLRLHGLDRWPFDGDELYSHYDVQRLLSRQGLPDGVQGYPLGYLLMAASVALFGPGEFGLRFAPAVCSVLAVLALGALRRDAVPTGVAAVAATLAALSPWLVFHGQEARFYGPLLFFAALATLYALPGAGRRPIAAALAALLAAACHPSAALLVGSLAVAWLAGRVRPALLVVCGVLVASLGLLWVFRSEATLATVLRDAILRRGPGRYDTAAYIAGLGYNLGPVTGLLALAGLLSLRPRPGRPGFVLVVLGLLPPLLLLLPALAGVSVQQRYAMGAVPALLLLAGHGLVSLRGRPALAATAGLAALLVPLPETINLWRSGDRADYRAAAAWLSAHATVEDIVVADEHALLHLYLERLDPSVEWTLHEAPLDEAKRWGFVRNRREVWVLLKASRLRGAYGREFLDWIGAHFEPVSIVGEGPPPFARHDNRLVLHRRTERVVDPPPGGGR